MIKSRIPRLPQDNTNKPTACCSHHSWLEINVERLPEVLRLVAALHVGAAELEVVEDRPDVLVGAADT